MAGVGTALAVQYARDIEGLAPGRDAEHRVDDAFLGEKIRPDADDDDFQGGTSAA